MCVLDTVLGAVNVGYRVILPKDAACSSSDDIHDSESDLYHQRDSTQVALNICKRFHRATILPLQGSFLVVLSAASTRILWSGTSSAD